MNPSNTISSAPERPSAPDTGQPHLFLTQLRPSSTYPIRRELRTTIYSSIVD